MQQQQEEEQDMMESRRRRPNRSDIHVSMEEEMEIEEQTRDYFDALAPKRPSKPHRSDVFSSSNSDHHHPHTTTISPEFVKFQHLQQNDDDHPQKKLVDNGSQKVAEEEEYVETEYYKDLNCIDKQHHTTGTGFISVVAEEEENSNSINGGNCFKLLPAQEEENSTTTETQLHSSCKGNPATNDWIPSDQVMASSDTVILASHDKPNRSEN